MLDRNLLVATTLHFFSVNSHGISCDENHTFGLLLLIVAVQALLHTVNIGRVTLFELGNIPGISGFCMEDHNITGACRMSAITKMIMESMRLKTMTSSLVEIKGTNPPESRQGSNYTRLFDSAEYASLVSCVLGEELENVVSPPRFG
ncbi:hypothetical protein JHK84_032429 [Glycine max]|nr:hypothetical protein JHK84_032429 [Glycine max]